MFKEYFQVAKPFNYDAVSSSCSWVYETDVKKSLGGPFEMTDCFEQRGKIENVVIYLRIIHSTSSLRK